MIDSFIFENYRTGASVTFNTNNIPFKEFITYEDWRTEEREKVQEHGLWPSFTFLGKRTWQVEGDILENTSVEYNTTRKAIKAVCMPAAHLGFTAIGRIIIQLPGYEMLYSDVTVESLELPITAMSPSRGEYMITWVAFDPRCYSVNLYQAFLGTPNIITGRTYPKTYPKTYSALVGTNQVVCSNIGDLETYPAIEITGPIERPRLTLIRNSVEYVFTLGDLIIQAGDKAIINFKDRTVTSFVSGADWYGYAHDSVWWFLEPGNNTVRLDATGASSPAGAVIQWRNAYVP